MDNNKRKLLQEIQTHIGWPVVEEFLADYIKGLDLDGPIKRETEFETIWQRAEAEGGRDHLINFFKELENEARKYDS